MVDIPISLLFNFFVFLLVPFAFAYLARKMRISPIIGYIVGGLVLGNFFESFLAKETINNFAYFGIILLLFTVGLEVNFEQIRRVKRFIVIGGTLQLLLSGFFIFLLSLFFRFSLLQSFLIGLALSSSSTVLVAKIIQNRGEEYSFVGEIALGILMLQNLAFIPFLIIFTSITSASASPLMVIKDVLVSFFKAGIIIIALFYLGKKIVPFLFDKIARTSRELLNLFIILFIFFITYFSMIAHIPILIGVFIAGILVAQTLEHHHIFSQIRPLRDVLAVVFFVFVGTNIKLSIVLPLLPKIILFISLVGVAKIVIILFVFLFLKFHSRTAFTLSLLLFHIDEDAFILMFAAFKNGVVSLQEYLFVGSSLLLSLAITPMVIANRDRIYLGLRRLIKKRLPFLEGAIQSKIDQARSPIDVLTIKNHVVICGFGRVGGRVGRALTMTNIPFVAIDYNFRTVEKAKREGVNVIYGDPSDIDVLDYAEVDNALILISTVPDHLSQEAIVLNARRLNRNIIIIARVHHDTERERMTNLGVDVVVQPELEASLSITKRILYTLQLPQEEIKEKIIRLRREQMGR